ncbi:virulence protein RhuM/Fic/DOC family protein [bacterium]|nr:virulence protein RhuM/Fic/DOC family protein [bacterium]
MDDTKNQIVIYTAQNGQIQIDVKIQDETAWLTQDQMAKLFDTDRTAIVKHIKNILKEGELEEGATCAKIAQVQTEGKRQVQRHKKYYNLDMILSVGYRVTSRTATHFRIWANKVLKEFLLRGYAINTNTLMVDRSKMEALQESLNLFARSISNQSQTLEDAQGISNLLTDFVKGLNLLDDFDHKNLDVSGRTKQKAIIISEKEFLTVIDKMKGRFASDVFAKPKDDSFASSVGQIYQTFDNKDLYDTLEEKAAMLLYLVVKNHSFVDGNKRIGASCFVYFLNKNGLLYNDLKQPVIDDATLFALTLLIAESSPSEKETVKQVIISVLNRR